MKELLNNNSNEMKTIVETYIIEETESLIYDNETLDKWNNYVDSLGLEGQTKIKTPKNPPKQKIPTVEQVAKKKRKEFF